ncbi:helix-turn-helix domain-containing protein [Flavobacterium macrobrachii]|nr:helix-turn-helix transcriptional regulator [Flavobacterium macrobrachii]
MQKHTLLGLIISFMSFEKRIAELRKEKKISQEELSKKIGVHQNVIGRYERGEAKPSIEVATAIADVFNVSLDYLVGKTEFIVDEDITNRILTIQKLPEQDREHILFALDAMIRDAKARLAYSS